MKSLKKINNILIFTLIIIALLYFGSSFLIPLLFGVFFASLMTPFSNLLERIKFPRIISSLISTFLVFVVVGSILYLFAWQITLFVSDISSVRKEVTSLIQNIQSEITALTNLTPEDQQDIWKKRSDDVLNTIENGLTMFLGNILSTTAGFMLSLLYAAMLLYYRDKLSEFAMMYVKEENEDRAKSIMSKNSKVVYQYLWGRAQVMLLLGIMYYITFLLFDIPFALLLTLFGTLITIIPYLGPFISGSLPILFAIIYMQNIESIVFFSIIITTIQLIESYVLEPLIIGHEVKINPFTVIIAIILGGMIWGLAGMILFVPIFAMIKIMSNHTPGCEPISYLLGNSEKKSKPVAIN
jgi:predicted PurR-regulated permease PerM